MTLTQHRIASGQTQSEYADAQAYCRSADMRLSRDPVVGFWLHCDGSIRFVRSLGEIRGWVDYIERNL